MLSYYVSIYKRSEFCVVLSVTCYNFRIKTMFGSSLPPVVCECSCFIYVICVCLRIEVSNAYCVVCVFFVCFLRLVYNMLPVSLDCPFFDSPYVYFIIIITQISTLVCGNGSGVNIIGMLIFKRLNSQITQRCCRSK